MRYKHIIFDFGNVLASFDESHLLKQFCDKEEDRRILSGIIFPKWGQIDAGTLDYNDFCREVLANAPAHLKHTASDLLQNWHKHLAPIPQTWEFVKDLKKRGYHVYILSNAPTHFAEHADFYEITKEFEGIVFSAVIEMSKPNPDIYQYLFDTYHLNPKECFFLDDKKENIETGRRLGMDGIVFTGDIDAVKQAISYTGN